MSSFPRFPSDTVASAPANNWFFEFNPADGSVIAQAHTTTALEFTARMADFGHRADVRFDHPCDANRTTWAIVPVAGEADMASKFHRDSMPPVTIQREFGPHDSLQDVSEALASHIRQYQHAWRQSWRQKAEAQMAGRHMPRPTHTERVDDMMGGVAIAGR